jgi:hypothetical protein
MAAAARLFGAYHTMQSIAVKQSAVVAMHGLRGIAQRNRLH